MTGGPTSISSNLPSCDLLNSSILLSRSACLCLTLASSGPIGVPGAAPAACLLAASLAFFAASLLAASSCPFFLSSACDFLDAAISLSLAAMLSFDFLTASS